MDSARHNPTLLEPDPGSSLARLIQRLALAGVTMMLLLAVVSAYLRLSATGMGCTPWPTCYQERSAAPAPQGHPVARLAHRVLASGLGIVVIVIVSASVAMRPKRPVVLWTALALLTLTGLLAVLGRATSNAAGPGIALANLLGGMAMAALLWWLAIRAKGKSGPRDKPLRWLVAATLVLLLIQVSLGGVISTGRSAAACGSLPLCGVAMSSAPAVLHFAHRITALVLLIAACALAARSHRRDSQQQRHGLALAALLTLQVVSGATMVALDFPLWLALVHHAGALLLLLVGISVLAA